MKAVVIYKSKYGASRQYAEWIGEYLHLPLTVADNIKAGELADYDIIILGSPVYIGKLLVKNWLNKNAAQLSLKKLFLFIVCGTPSSDQDGQARIFSDNIPPGLQDHCQVFFFPGRLVRKKLSLTDRILLNIGARLEKDPERKKGMREDMDDVSKKFVNPLVEAVNNTISGMRPSFQSDITV